MKVHIHLKVDNYNIDFHAVKNESQIL